jgi:hypothetical protein
MAGGAAASALVSLSTNGTPGAMTAVMLVCSLGALAAWITLVRPSAAGTGPEPEPAAD